jgi:hypothetical protein
MNKKALKKFYKEEAKEPAHKDIKNALLSGGETPMPKKKHKKVVKKGKAKHKKGDCPSCGK